jgi:hypothetical protein
MLFKPRTMDEACVQAQYLENIGQKKGNPSGSKKKEHQEASKEGKKKWKGGKRIRRHQPLHISERIPTTIAIIATLMATLRKSVGNYIQS